MNHTPIQTESIATRSRSEMIDVTEIVQDYVTRQGVVFGFAYVYVPHTTAAITINENADPDVKLDLLRKLDELVPKSEPYYRHDEGNSDSHLKASLVGSSVTVIIEQGRLVLGRWQGIYFCEFDGPRRRDLLIKFLDLTPPPPP